MEISKASADNTLLHLSSRGEQGMAQWWEHSPPTNVARVQIPASTPYVGWVCCWFSPLLRGVFLRVLQFSPLLKNQHFQIPIRSGTHGHVSTSSYELLSDPWVNKLQFIIQIFYLQYLKNVYCVVTNNNKDHNRHSVEQATKLQKSEL